MELVNYFTCEFCVTFVEPLQKRSERSNQAEIMSMSLQYPAAAVPPQGGLNPYGTLPNMMSPPPSTGPMQPLQPLSAATMATANNMQNHNTPFYIDNILGGARQNMNIPARPTPTLAAPQFSPAPTGGMTTPAAAQLNNPYHNSYYDTTVPAGLTSPTPMSYGAGAFSGPQGLYGYPRPDYPPGLLDRHDPYGKGRSQIQFRSVASWKLWIRAKRIKM